MLKMLCSLIPSSGTLHAFFFFEFFFSTKEPSARRNEHGQLEPDAEESVIQNSLGFGGYEHAPKAEIRNPAKDSSPTTS